MHLVGTLPQFHDPGAALSWQRTALAGRVRRLTGGETGDRANWIVPVVQRLAREPVVRRVRSGGWTGYDDVDRFAVRRGQRLGPEHLDLRVARYGSEELDLLAGSGHPATEELPLQVGVPGSFDVALFSFGPAAALRLEPVFRRGWGRTSRRCTPGPGVPWSSSWRRRSSWSPSPPPPNPCGRWSRGWWRARCCGRWRRPRPGPGSGCTCAWATWVTARCASSRTRRRWST